MRIPVPLNPLPGALNFRLKVSGFGNGDSRNFLFLHSLIALVSSNGFLIK